MRATDITPEGIMNAKIATVLALLPLWGAARSSSARAESSDESVFVRGLSAAQHEALLYVWTSDADADDPDFLSVIDADPRSPSYATVIATAPTGSAANEAHHFGYTTDADRIFAGGLFSNRLFIYDVKSDPRHPVLLRTVPDLVATTGFSGPHTFYAVPGGVMIAMLGGKDGGAPGALVKLDNDGKFLQAMPAPEYM
jgi:selenium-binding protein 1